MFSAPASPYSRPIPNSSRIEPMLLVTANVSAPSSGAR